MINQDVFEDLDESARNLHATMILARLSFNAAGECQLGDLDTLIELLRETSGCWVNWHCFDKKGRLAAIRCRKKDAPAVGLALTELLRQIAAKTRGQERARQNDEFLALDSQAAAMGSP